MIHRYCISHTKPLLPEAWYDHCIALGDFEPDSAYNVRQLDRFWHEARPIAYGAAGAHVLPVVIKRFSDDADLIEVCSYRKKIIPPMEGTESGLFPNLRELNLENFGRVAELSVFVPRAEVGFLVAQPLHFKKSILGHYALVHHRKDIVDYSALAVELGVLDRSSADDFLALQHFIPGGAELGIYPKAWLLQAWTDMELVGRQFLERYSDRVKKYDSYQIRAVNFLSERLGSYLLIRHFKQKFANNIPSDLFGYMTNIVDDRSNYTAAVADASKNRSGRFNVKQKRAK
jgi:hypothetical protein